MLRVWWCALHAVLVVAACLVAWPWYVKLVAGALTMAHAWWRRPRPPAVVLLVAADGACRIPKWGPEVFALTRRTRLTRLALDLHVKAGPRGGRLLLLADQLDRDDWARLSAILRRASVE